MNTITIDCGASFLKGAIFNEKGRLLRQMQWSSPPVRGSEDIHRPLQIQALLAQVQQMIENLSVDMDEAYLCLANEMHGFLLAYEDGTPYTDYISWQKEFGHISVNGKDAIEELSDKELEQDIQHSGMLLRAGLPNVNLLYLLRSGLVKETIHPIYFYTLGDYLLRCLSGRQPNSHPTNAAATGLFDVSIGDWNQHLLDFIGATKIRFPMICDKAMSFVMNHCRIYALPALGDQQAALYGAGLSTENELSFNLGTGAQVSTIATQVEWSEQYQLRPYLEGRYIKTVPHLPSGRALNVYIRFMKTIFDTFKIQMEDTELWTRLIAAAEQASETDIKCDLSFFSNPLTPYVRGSIMNIGENALTIGTLWRSVFQQMGQNFVWAAERVMQDKSRINKVIFSGGVARKITPIQQCIRKYYGDDIEYQVATNETLYGLYKYGLNYCNKNMEG